MIGFYLIWASNFQKNSTVPYKSWNFFSFEIGHAGYQKKRNFALISKMCRSLEFGKRETIFYRKPEFLGTRKILQKIVFLRKNLWELLDARVLHIFEISAKFHFFLYPARPISKKFFSTLERGGATFFEG